MLFASIGGDEARGPGGVQPTLNFDFLPPDGSRAGEVWPADRQRVAGQRRGAAVGGFDIASERHGRRADSRGALTLEETGDHNRVGAVLRSPVAAVLAVGPARVAAA